LRLERIEHSALADTLSALVSDLENPAIRLRLPYQIAREAVNLAMRFPSAELGALHKTYNFAAELTGKDCLTPQELAALETSHPLLWQMFHIESAQPGELMGPTDWAAFEVEQGSDRLHRVVCEKFVKAYEAVPL